MDNLRSIGLMTLAMAGFAFEDMFIKRASQSLPTGQILIVLGFGGALVFSLICRARGLPVLSRRALHPLVLTRNFGELFAALGFVTALALIPLSLATALLQTGPLLVTAGAALLLGEQVGWRRWTAVSVGLVGVLVILRPGFEGFRPAALFAVQGAVGLAIRELATRRIPADISSLQLSAWAYATIMPTGLILLLFDAGIAVPDAATWLNLAGAVGIGAAAYWAIVAAMRMGELSVVIPFRYTRLIFAILVGMAVFAERPDLPTLIGAAIIVASGLYTIWREHSIARRAVWPG